ncbi:sensor histidine kinase [Viscerimonas tarda]
MGRIKTNKLLNKMLRYYLVSGLLVFLAAILLFYMFQKIHYAHEMVEYLYFFLGLMAAFMLATRLIYKRLWHPFFQTLSQIEQFNIKNNEMPQFPQTGIKEFIQLNNALEKLAENNMNAYKIQKEFTENASHEMQTPLAVFQSKLDILIQQPGLTEEHLSIIQSLYDTTSRLSRINKNLLLLAKIDNLQFVETQTINVTEVIPESLSFLTEQAAGKNICIETDIVRDSCRIEANRTLIESLFNNLITNAIRHNTANGRISVAFNGKRLTVANTGINHPLDEKMLFRRFGQMTGKTRGSGLGLAIVQQICVLNKWQIHYGFNRGMHRFTVTF